uniref:Immunoglobulin I-set domain-containing protein n=1 Tax=Esox lucius TaxID=8010 RepID=A0AAY5KE41_ESOLU
TRPATKGYGGCWPTTVRHLSGCRERSLVGCRNKGRRREGRGRRLVVFDNGTLFLPSVGMGEEGEYVCHAENPWGKDTMRVAVKRNLFQKTQSQRRCLVPKDYPSQSNLARRHPNPDTMSQVNNLTQEAQSP